MITSKNNRLLKLYSELQKKKFRYEYGLFPAEGKRLIMDLIDCGLSPHLVLYRENFDDIGFLEKVCSLSDEGEMVREDLFHKLTDTVSEQGIVAAFPMLCPELQSYQGKEQKLYFILNQVQDPGNLGAIIRNCAAAGVEAVFLEEGCADLFNPKVVRSTMGALAKIPVFYHLSGEEIFSFCQREKIEIFLSDMVGKIPYWDLPENRRVAVVFGNEGNGIDAFWQGKNLQRTYIPQKNGVESLNVSMAGGIIAFDFLRKSLK